MSAPVRQSEIPIEFTHLLEHVPEGARDQYKTKAHAYERTFVYPQTFAHPQKSILDITSGIASDVFQDLIMKELFFVRDEDKNKSQWLPGGVWKMVTGYYVPDIAALLLNLFKSAQQYHDCTVFSQECRDTFDVFGPFVKELSCPSELGLDYINHQKLAFLTRVVPNLESLSIPININEKNDTIGLIARGLKQLKHLKTGMGTSHYGFGPEFDPPYLQFCSFSKLIHLETLDLGEGYTSWLLKHLKFLPKLSTLVLPSLSDYDGSHLKDFPSLTKLDLRFCYSPFENFSHCAKLAELTIRESMTYPNMAGLSKCKSLKKLDIRGCKRVTHDACTSLIKQLKGLTLMCDHEKSDL